MSWFNLKGVEIAYTIHENFRNKGYVTEALEYLIDYCFNELGVSKIYADTIPSNKASQKVLEKLNLKLEGVIRERQFENGKRVDELDYGLLKREWKRR